jgi:hypothetical protein
VRHFEHHDKGKTWRVVKEVLEKDLKYKVFFKALDASILVFLKKELDFI